MTIRRSKSIIGRKRYKERITAMVFEGITEGSKT
jgi:hypothetical protein